MVVFRIDATVRSPFILLDPESGIIEISGRSFLEDSELFYKPVIEWIEEYIKSPSPKTIFICKLEYYNNSASKIIYTLIRKMDNRICYPNKLEIQWFYQKNDDEMKEKGEDMTHAIKNAEVKFIEINCSLNKPT